MRAEAELTVADGVWHEWTVSADGASTEAMLRVAELATDFGAALALGAFCAAAGERPGCTIGAEGATLSGTRVRWTYGVTAIDVRYARTLRNALLALEQVEQVAMVVHARQVPPVAQTLNLVVDSDAVERGTFYAGRRARYPFGLRDDDPVRLDQNRRVLVEYPVSVDESIEDALSKVIVQWEKLAAFGYPVDEAALVEGRCGILAVESAVFDEVTYEIAVQTFASAEAAWTPLLNLLAWMPEHVRCASVVIE